ncbi:M16 family metallopeptidase [Algoriphagus zhangzhouensis]|uniref:M16 family metallopeptidase n=1 Tax=Algoriphagus zhangzhouensis TaxID=1073327 RepID=UPI001416F186|nr:M16 family metallopeptidase [Algoriphagus zhangzhouensis]
MNKKVTRILFVLGFVSQSILAQSQAEHTESVVGKLENGFTYYLLPEEAPGKISVRVLANTGSYVESPFERGFAHLLEHMIFKGSKRYPGEKSIEALELMGLRFGKEYNAATNKTETNYYFNISSENPKELKKLLIWIRESMFDLQMEVMSFEKEKNVVIEEIGKGKGSVNPYLVGTLLEGHNGLGTPEEVASAQFEELQNFYNKFYTTSQMALVIQGKVDRSLVKKYIEQVFNSVRKTGSAPKNKYPDISKQTVIRDDYQPSRPEKFPLLAIAFKSPEIELGDYPSFRSKLVRSVFCEMLENRLVNSSGSINRKSTLSHMNMIPGTSMFNLRLYGDQDITYRDLLIEFTRVINQAKEYGFATQEVEFFFNRRLKTILDRKEEPLAWKDVKESFLEETPIVSKTQELQWMEQLQKELPEIDFVEMLDQMMELEKTIFFDGSSDAFDTEFTDEFILEKLRDSQESLNKIFEFVPPQQSFVIKSELEPIFPRVEEKKAARIIHRIELGDDLYLLKYENGASVIVYNSGFAPSEIKLLGNGGLNRLPLQDRSAFAASIDLLEDGYGEYSSEEVSQMERSLGIRKKTEITDFEFEYSVSGKKEFLKEMIQVFVLSITEGAFPDSIDFKRKYTSKKKKESVKDEDYESFKARLDGTSIKKGELPDFSPELLKKFYDYRQELVQDLSNSVFYLGGDLPPNVDDLISSSIGNLPLYHNEHLISSEQTADLNWNSIETPNEFEFDFNRDLPLVEHYFGQPAQKMSFDDELVNEGIAEFGFSRIYEIIRRKYGYIYVMGTTSFVEKYPKPFNSLSFRFMVDSGNVQNATKAMQEEVLVPMTEGDISTKDLRKIKGMLGSKYVLNFYEPEQISNDYLKWYLRYGNAFTIDELKKQIDGISRRDVSRQMKSLVRPEFQIKILRLPTS